MHSIDYSIHIVGLGAVGTLLAVAFAKAGFSVHTYGGRDTVSQLKLSVGRAESDDTISVTEHSAKTPQALHDNDAVLIAVKWPSLISVLSAIGPRISRTNAVLLPQNGMVDVELDAFGSYLTLVPIVVHASAERIEHGTIVANGNAEFLVCDNAPLPASAKLQREGFRFLAEREFQLAQLLKLLIACTSAKMALQQLSIGAAFRNPYIRNELAAIVREAGLVLFTYREGDLIFKSEIDVLVQRITSGVLVDVDLMESAYTSMHYDLNVRHQETEAAWINGFINRLAQRFNIDTPLNNSLLEELERRQISDAIKKRSYSEYFDC